MARRMLRAKFHPHRCNVSPLLGEKTQNRPLSNLNKWRFALRAMLPVNNRDLRTVAQVCLEVNQTLHDVWPSPALVHNIYIFWGCCPLTKFCVLLYWQRYCTALEQWVSAKLCGVVQGIWNYQIFTPRHFQQRAPPIFRGWPLRWAWAHILALC